MSTACTADRARTAEAAASKPIQLIQPIYAKRVRAEVAKDRNPSQSIKRLCSLASGVRATRQGTPKSPRASSGLLGASGVKVDPNLMPSKTTGRCTPRQPGESSHTGLIGTAQTSTDAREKERAAHSSSKRACDNACQPQGKRARTTGELSPCVRLRSKQTSSKYLLRG